MITLIICILLIIVAGAAKACHNIIDHKFNESIFSLLPESWHEWLDPKLSWYNKYEIELDVVAGTQTEKPAFFGSTTFLVWLTDLWHFASMVENTCLLAATALMPSLFTVSLGWHPIWVFGLDLLLLKLCFTGSFSLFYNHIFKLNSPMKNLNFKLYRFVADAFTLTNNAASRLIAFLYFFFLVGFGGLISLIFDNTPVWQDYDRFRFSHLLIIVLTFFWIGWMVYMYGFGGARKLEEKYQEGIRSKEDFPENLY